MIPWLLEGTQNLTEPPEAFLSAAELETFATFRFPKRRNDWLLGRWTAKRLLQALVFAQTGQMIAGRAVEILNDADGAPFALLNGRPLAINFSISHSNGYALCASPACALVEGPEVRLGADLEIIESRDGYLVSDYFTAKEQARVETISPALLEIAVTTIWSAKEAVLKALHKGLSVDPRAVEICLPPFESAPLKWTRFDMAWRGNDATVPPFYGWWCVQAGFVLTLAVSTRDAPDKVPALLENSWNRLGANHGKGHGVLSHRIAYATRHHARHQQGY